MSSVTVAIGEIDGGDAEAGVDAAIRRAGPGGRPSPLLRIVAPADPDELPDLVVRTRPEDRYQIVSPTGTPLTEEVVDVDGQGATRIVRYLEHIARWRRIGALANGASGLAGSVRLEIVAAEPGERLAPRDRAPLRSGAGGAIELRYRYGPYAPVAPTVFIRLRNTTEMSLFCVLLTLTDQYRIHADLLPGEYIRARQLAVAQDGEPRAAVRATGPRAAGGTGTELAHADRVRGRDQSRRVRPAAPGRAGLGSGTHGDGSGQYG